MLPNESRYAKFCKSRSSLNNNKQGYAMIFKMGEFFCGAGGLAWGAKQAVIQYKGKTYSVEHAFAVDNNRQACRTYSHNICGGVDATVYCRDVREIDISKLPEIDAFAFGFPCNDFSIVGEHKGIKGKYGPLYTYGVKVLQVKKPKWFIAENVGGLHSANEGKTFKAILSALSTAGMGYDITPHIYHFEDYGVPQRRHRIVIVGTRQDLKLKFKVPAPTTAGKPRTAKDAIMVPFIRPDAANHELTTQSSVVIERLKHIPEGKNAWCSELPERLRLNVRGARLSQIYRRLHSREPAYTVTGSGGGGTHVYHWSEPRALTNRERARLQTFPDNFLFLGGKEDVRKQIGMAVPPLGAQVVVEAVLKTFARMPYDSVPAHWEDVLSEGKEV